MWPNAPYCGSKKYAETPTCFKEVEPCVMLTLAHISKLSVCTLRSQLIPWSQARCHVLQYYTVTHCSKNNALWYRLHPFNRNSCRFMAPGWWALSFHYVDKVATDEAERWVLYLVPSCNAAFTLRRLMVQWCCTSSQRNTLYFCTSTCCCMPHRSTPTEMLTRHNQNWC